MILSRLMRDRWKVSAALVLAFWKPLSAKKPKQTCLVNNQLGMLTQMLDFVPQTPVAYGGKLSYSAGSSTYAAERFLVLTEPCCVMY